MRWLGGFRGRVPPTAAFLICSGVVSPGKEAVSEGGEYNRGCEEETAACLR